MSAAQNAVVQREPQNITREKIKKFLPKGSSVQVTDEVLNAIAQFENDTGLPQNLLEEDFMSYMHLIGKVAGVGLMELANAIKYCNLKRNHSNKRAWAIVFPSKYDELTNAGKEIDSYVSMYNSSKLVVAIDKEMLVPAYIQYSSYHHAAIKKQYDLMRGIGSGEDDKVSAMVQHLAAKELAILTKMPEDKSIEIKVGQSDAVMSAQQEMNNHLAAIVANQAAMFASGMKPDQIQKIHSAEVIGMSVVEAEIEEEDVESTESTGSSWEEK